MFNIGIVGDTGMVGSEICRLLAGRGGIDVAYRRNTKREEGRLSGCDIVFFATKDEESMRSVPEALNAGARAIDMSGAFRLGRPEFEKWYGLTHLAPELIDGAVYGMTALCGDAHRDKIARAGLVAVPGCYPTAVILALRPLKGLIAEEATVFATSGNSGARREVDEISNEISYSYGTLHKHVPEMHKYTNITIDFVPVVLRSVFRGINATIRVKLSGAAESADSAAAAALLENAARSAYCEEDLVEVVRDTKDHQYGTRDVACTNKLLVKINVDGGYAYINSIIDNLYKGAAGQAVECMNIMLGEPRLRGLETGGQGVKE